MKKVQPDLRFYTYVYRHPVTLVPFYVGKGTGNRHLSHLKEKDHYNRRFKGELRNIRKLGLDPLVEKVSGNTTDLEARLEEIRLIAKWGRRGYEETGILVNQTLGGDGRAGYSPSKETMKKIADKQRGVKRPNSRQAISEGTKLAMADPAIRKKISDARINAACPEITKQKLSKHFSVVRKGAGNPAAKTWKVISPDGVETIVADLRGFCEKNSLSYVGLKAAYRKNRKVLRGSSVGWGLISAAALT